MMKTSNKLLASLFALILLGITLFVGAARYYSDVKILEPSGHVSSISGTLEKFSDLQLRGNLKVYLTQSLESRYEIKGDANLINNVVIDKKDGILNIYPKDKMDKNQTIELYLYFPSVNNLEIIAGTQVVCLNEIKAEQLFVKLTAGVDASLRLNINDLHAETAAGAHLFMKGIANRLQLVASAGSIIVANDLFTKQSIVKGSAGANIHLNVSEKITAKLSSGSSLTYSGNPSIKNIETASGAIVNAQ